MTPTAPTEVPSTSGKTRWAARLRRFGQLGLSVVLLAIGALWGHELFVDPADRQIGKLFVLWVLLPLGVLASLSLGVAWTLDRGAGEQRRGGGPDRI